MRRPVDVAIMFGVLWLLGSMVIDVLTPKELTVFMIAAATGPTVISIGLWYYLSFPMIDFGMVFAASWLVAALALELISPKPLPSYLIGMGLVPALIIGAILHWHRYRSGESWRTSASSQAAPRPNQGGHSVRGSTDEQDPASARADAAS